MEAKANTSIADSKSIPDLSESQIQESKIKDILTFFKQTPLQAVQPRPSTGTIHAWKDNDIIGVQENERLPRVFNKMIVEGILSMPVLDQHRRYVDTIDLLAIVVFVAKLFQGLKSEWTEDETQSFFEKGKEFIEASVETVLRDKKRRDSLPVSEGTNALQGLAIFSNREIHRIPVISPERRVVGFYTQSMAISLLSQNMAALGSLKDVTVAQMASAWPLSHEVLCVPEETPTIDVFRLLSERNISGVGIVNKEGQLVDSISVRDLRGIGNNAAKWRRLALPVKAFKHTVRSEFSAQTPKEVLTVKMSDTLGQVLNLLDDGNLHRVFVVEDGKPKSVVSQGDVLGYLAKVAGLPPFTSAPGSPAGVGVGSGSGQASGVQQQPPGSPPKSPFAPPSMPAPSSSPLPGGKGEVGQGIQGQGQSSMQGQGQGAQSPGKEKRPGGSPPPSETRSGTV